MGIFDSVVDLLGALNGGNEDAVNEGEWFCEHCKARLNDQTNFTTLPGHWICTECGHDSNVSEPEENDVMPMLGNMLG